MRKSDAYNVDDQDMTYEITKNEDEIKLDDDSDNSDETEKSATKRFSLSLPAPKNDFIDDRTDKGKYFCLELKLSNKICHTLVKLFTKGQVPRVMETENTKIVSIPISLYFI